MQVIEGGDGCSEVALGMVQLLYVPCYLFDLWKEEETDGERFKSGEWMHAKYRTNKLSSR